MKRARFEIVRCWLFASVLLQQHGSIRGFQVTGPRKLPRFGVVWPHQTFTSAADASIPAARVGTEAKTTPQEAIEAQRFLIHKRGQTAEMIKGAPALGGVTLCRGWSDEATRAFVKAVDAVVRKNPILTGHVYDQAGSLWIQSGTYTPENHEFVQILEPPDNVPDLGTMNPTQIMEYISSEILPLVEQSTLTSAQIKKKLPLFAATLMTLNDEYTVFSVKVSHAVVDGTSFFQLLKQLSLRMSGPNNGQNIDWDVPAKATHEFYPPNMSKRDVFNYYGPPFMLGAAKNILTQKRQPQYLLLNKQKVSAAKRALREQLGSNGVSSNDIITSAVCQSNPTADVFVLTENIRGRVEGIPPQAGGNFIWEVPLSRQVCLHPEQLRKVIESGESGYATNQLPLMPFLCGRHARISSLASIAENVVFNGVTTVAVAPFSSFLSDIPMDVAVVFRFSGQCWGILHNFAEFKPCELLQEILED